MSAPEDLREVYLDELKDLWSANDQMKTVVEKLAGVAKDSRLKSMLDKSVGGIQKHTELLKDLLAENGEEVAKEHCKGMQGLVAEAKKHALDEKFDDDAVRDVVIIAQYQRMTHYGIAGFGTVASFAGTLGLKDDAEKLERATGEIYTADEYMTKIAEACINESAEA